MTRAVRWGWIVAALAVLGLGLVVAFVVSLGTAPDPAFERGSRWLLALNMLVALLLAGVVVAVAWRLWKRLRRGRFGSRLLLKLAATFALVGVLPGAMIYAVGWQFASRSIDAWFDERMAMALDAGLALGRSMLESMQSDLGARTDRAVERLARDGEEPGPLTLERLREQLGASEVSLIGPAGQVLANAGGRSLVGERPSAGLLREARAGRIGREVEGLDDPSSMPRLRVLVALPSPGLSLQPAPARHLMVVQPLPRGLAYQALAVQAAYSEYQQRALARDALRAMVIGTLTLALVLSVFAAVLLAIVLGNQITRPLLMLADGVREVASGNLAARPVFPSSDELGGLTRSFAAMVRQVFEARAQVQRGADALEAARGRLQTILDNLSSGVLVFAPDGAIEALNPSAARVLGVAPAQALGGPLARLPGLATLAEAMDRHARAAAGDAEAGRAGTWQDTVELPRADGLVLTLLLRGAPLPGGGGVLLFDDIGEVVSAQRARAWSEVARRLAHEIKNPLTPIRLSAERLQHRLQARLEGADQAMLARSVATIVEQVEAMRRMVDEFRDYARLPTARPQPLGLNDLVADVLALYGPALDSGRLRLQVTQDLPPIMGDGQQLRQVIHNLVQNALDALDAAAERPQACATLSTQAVREEPGGAVSAVRLVVEDEGPGFADAVLQRAFEPYVTTKARGTGLGLALVRKIADEHRATVRLRNRRADARDDAPVLGARVSISFSALADGVGLPPTPSSAPAPAPPAAA